MRVTGAIREATGTYTDRGRNGRRARATACSNCLLLVVGQALSPAIRGPPKSLSATCKGSSQPARASRSRRAERHLLSRPARLVNGLDNLQRLIAFFSGDQRLALVLDRFAEIAELPLQRLH
jgi:hypothetical protein